jgi:uncharacterized protein YycO
MSYSAHMDLLFRRGVGFSSRVLGWWGGDYYSHVDIVWPDGQLLGARSDLIKVGDVIYPTGFQFRPDPYEKVAALKRVRIPCTSEELIRANAWALSQRGKPYDWLAIFAFAINRNWRDEDAWFCSEAGTRYIEMGLGIELPVSPSKVPPGKLLAVAGALAAERGMPVAA